MLVSFLKKEKPENFIVYLITYNKISLTNYRHDSCSILTKVDSLCFNQSILFFECTFNMEGLVFFQLVFYFLYWKLSDDLWILPWSGVEGESFPSIELYTYEWIIKKKSMMESTKLAKRLRLIIQTILGIIITQLKIMDTVLISCILFYYKRFICHTLFTTIFVCNIYRFKHKLMSNVSWFTSNKHSNQYEVILKLTLDFVFL